MRILFFLVFLFFVMGSTQITFTLPFDSIGYDGYAESVKDKYVVYWKLIDADHIEFAVAAENPSAPGWVGLGFNRWNGMPLADVVIARFPTDGDVLIEDYYAPEFGYPVMDESQDITVIDSGITGGVSWFKFSRPLRTCDKRDNDIDYDVDLYLLMAFGSMYGDNIIVYHYETKESFRVSLAGEASYEYGPDVNDISVTAPAVTVAASSSSYVCSYHELPADQPYHLVGYNVVRDNANVFHHITASSCTSSLISAGIASSDGAVIQCGSEMGLCNTPFLSGGYGSGTQFPENLGVAIGQNAVRYIVLSRHFYNTASLNTEVDASGYILKYTDQLRDDELAIFAHVATDFTIPAQTQNHVITSEVPSLATQEMSPITLLDVSFHMHYSGVRITLRHVGFDGIELPPIANFDPWDPVYGSTFIVNRVVNPGDRLITECVYTNNFVHELVSGAEQTQEMCTTTLSYYPKQDNFTLCVEFPNGYQAPSWTFEGRTIFCSPMSFNQDSYSQLEALYPGTAAKYNIYPLEDNAVEEYEDACPTIEETEIESSNVCADFSLPSETCSEYFSSYVYEDLINAAAQGHRSTKASGGFSLDGTANEVREMLLSTQSPNYGYKYVEAGVPEESLIYMKLKGESSVGTRMPVIGNYYTEEQLEVLSTWICCEGMHVTVSESNANTDISITSNGDTLNTVDEFSVDDTEISSSIVSSFSLISIILGIL